MSLAERLVARWYGGSRRPWLPRPLTWLYRAIVAMRVAAYRRGWLKAERLPVPVLVVGNIALGGTGKTPLVIALTRHLRACGWRPGVVSRGYGGNVQGTALLPDTLDPEQFGDEPSLIRRRAGVPVAVGHDRPAAARLLLDAGCDLVIADDGLQHYALARDVEINVVDGTRRLGNGLMLPCGPLREPPSRLERVDFCVVNGGEARDGEVAMMLAGSQACRLDQVDVCQPLSQWVGRRVHAVAGIGHPQRFFDSLRAQGLDVVEHAFADHHAYVSADLAFGDDAPVLMTEKDAVKCAAFATDRMWSVPVDAVLPDTFLQALDARLRQTSR
ncbi:MAG TPA: tetraacyldisaccharide 4'-kinase [Rhodanobacteraceae bacterium]